MKKTMKILLVTTLIIGCDRAQVAQKQKAKEEVVANLSLAAPIAEYKEANANSNGSRLASYAWGGSNPNGFISSSAAVEDLKDTTRKFIRAAEMQFRVKNVLYATYSIEEIAKQFGGFVTYTHLASTIDKKNITPVSVDSSLETLYYTVDNNITLRVPNTKLDTTLKAISLLIDYLDYRTIKAEDVALQLLSNRLAQDRAMKSGKRLEADIDEQGRRLKETTPAEELLDQRREQADASKIANLTLMDKIKFSTITLNIYQRQTIKRELIANDKNIDAYKPGFGTELVYALKWGWNLLQEIIVFISRLWGLILLGVITYVLYKIFKRKE